MNTESYKPSLPKNKDYFKTISEMKVDIIPNEIIFSYLTDVLIELGEKTNIFDLITLQNPNPPELKTIMHNAFNKIQKQTANTALKEKLLKMWDYVAQEDLLKNADLIFVFGGAEPERALEAIKLFNDGWAEKIMFSGKGPSYLENVKVSEAEKAKKIAKEMGINDDNIIIETESINTPENVAKSLVILKQQNIILKKVILVSAPYHLLRAYLTFKAFTGNASQLIRHAARIEGQTSNEYYKNNELWNYIFFEYVKIYIAKLMKHC